MRIHSRIKLNNHKVDKNANTLKTNNIQHVDRSDPSILELNTDGSVNIAGTMTYEDVTNVDSCWND